MIDKHEAGWHSRGVEIEQNEKTHPKNTIAVKILIVGLFIIVIGILIIIGGKGISFFKPLLTQPGPSSTMLEPAISVSENLKKTGILGELKTVEIELTNFKFLPNEIIVNKGDTVQITLKNSGGLHNFILEGYKIHTKSISSGESENITFVADKNGIFEFYCGIGNHKTMGMVGTLIVK